MTNLGKLIDTTFYPQLRTMLHHLEQFVATETDKPSALHARSAYAFLSLAHHEMQRAALAADAPKETPIE